MKKLVMILLVFPAILGSGCDSSMPGNSANTNATQRVPPPLGSNGNGKVNTSGTPVSTPSPAPKDKAESLFSFPPPKVIDYTEIPYQKLVNREGPTTFSNVSQKLAAALENAGYQKGKYSYFWNNDNEFAIVTKMEIVNEDGTPAAGNERWEIKNHLPTARNPSEYMGYLLRGKKVFYRVFAFIVTNKDYLFSEGSAPPFEMARKWMSEGKGRLGGAGSSAIKEVPFDEQYRCYVLLYLFVNHTSLDNPKPVDDEQIDDGLKRDLNKDVWKNLEQTKIIVGE